MLVKGFQSSVFCLKNITGITAMYLFITHHANTVKAFRINLLCQAAPHESKAKDHLQIIHFLKHSQQNN